MAIPKKLLDQIKKQCGAEKYGDDNLSDYLVKIYDSHEAKEKIQANNVDLVKQREESKKSLSEFKDQIKTFQGSKDELEKQIEALKSSSTNLTDDQKLLLDKGMSREVEGQFNTMSSDIKKQQDAMTLLMGQLKESDAKTKAAELSAKKENLNTILTSALQKVNIHEPDKLRTALSVISANKMADVKDDSSFIFGYQEEGKPFTFNNENELASYFAKSHEFLVSASGKSGGGSSYKPNANSYDPVDLNNPTVTLRQQNAQAGQQIDDYFN
jgi:hypothetical protein